MPHFCPAVGLKGGLGVGVGPTMSARLGQWLSVMGFKAVVEVGVVAALLAAGPAGAAEVTFLNRFHGSWMGSGTVVHESVDLLRFSCSATGKHRKNHIAISGNCRAVLGSRNFAADLSFDPRSGRYTGTYVGHKVGPAKLTGRRKGNVVNLTITWPKPVHGDLRARMVIENSGSGVLKILIADRLSPDGPEAMTAFTLKQI
jgi:hypothetical protein